MYINMVNRSFVRYSRILHQTRGLYIIERGKGLLIVNLKAWASTNHYISMQLYTDENQEKHQVWLLVLRPRFEPSTFWTPLYRIVKLHNTKVGVAAMKQKETRIPSQSRGTKILRPFVREQGLLGYGLDNREMGIRIPVEERDPALVHNVQTGSGVRPASSPPERI
jgi:hypothetical protein